jgi:surfeit locus 1 family protein
MVAGAATPVSAASPWPRRLLFPTAAEIGAATGYLVRDFQVLLAAGEADGYLRDWRPTVMTPDQHLGYAVQWFALAVALVVIYAALNFRKRPKPSP